MDCYCQVIRCIISSMFILIAVTFLLYILQETVNYYPLILVSNKLLWCFLIYYISKNWCKYSNKYWYYQIYFNFLLEYQDSNLNTNSQNVMCYRYTISQYLIFLKNIPIISFHILVLWIGCWSYCLPNATFVYGHN